jgi:hypothetical protein
VAVQEFQKQNAKMGMANEMMDDTIDGMFEGGDDEADELVDQARFALALCSSRASERASMQQLPI